MKVGFVSLGCPKNLVDSEVMLGLTRQAGHTLTSDPADADVLVVNTCAFIESARQESIDAILEMAAQKTAGRCRRLVVTGCLSERYRDELQRQIPEIDVVLGTDEVPTIVDAVSGRLAGGAAHPLPLIRPGRGEPTYLYDAETPREIATPGHFAYVKVAEGCDYACSFCIIPRLRGRYRSRPADSIVREAQSLVDRGVREIILVSQDTTFYGVDRGERGALARLLTRLNRIDGLTWIRLLYLYPTTVTDETLAAMADCEKVCGYVDLPLQHVARRVLRQMRRPGGRAAYERLIRRIRHRVPGVALRTTFIVGFPGETAEEFSELASFVREVRFDHLGVFTYSHEEGTPAGQLEDSVPRRVKLARQRALMSLQQRLVARANRARVGERVAVLMDGPSPESTLVLTGRLEGQAPDIDSAVYLTEADLAALKAGDLVEATVTAARGYDLVVRLKTDSKAHLVELASPVTVQALKDV
jgi:ribosomal protein S12 methylthiotransferase